MHVVCVCVCVCVCLCLCAYMHESHCMCTCMHIHMCSYVYIHPCRSVMIISSTCTCLCVQCCCTQQKGQERTAWKSWPFPLGRWWGWMRSLPGHARSPKHRQRSATRTKWSAPRMGPWWLTWGTCTLPGARWPPSPPKRTWAQAELWFPANQTCGWLLRNMTSTQSELCDENSGCFSACMSSSDFYCRLVSHVFNIRKLMNVAKNSDSLSLYCTRYKHEVLVLFGISWKQQHWPYHLSLPILNLTLQ